MSYEAYANWKGWDAAEFGQFNRGEDVFYNTEVKAYLPSALSGSTVIEIGFGNGSFLGWGRKNGLTVIGIEIQPVLRERAEQSGFPVIDDLRLLEPLSVDIVAAFDVFEHIPYDSLQEMCRQAARVLKPGGYLIARFPNGDSPFALPVQNGDPTHVNAIGAGFIGELMRSTGFELRELRAPTETPLHLRARLVLPIKKLMRSAVRAYVRFAFLGATTPSTFHLNYMMIARKPSEIDAGNGKSQRGARVTALRA
ncbi:class I SAM-dependent methyltransferase [Labrys sp. La1]|uniref:class I SAM-dependent methyltransferase n=1 Tax=Labrys sp. La1 TaxID=3404917 RepID=UPI003EBB1F95